MVHVTCVVCGVPGPEASNLFEADEAARVDAGFIKIAVPQKKDPRRSHLTFFCPHCTTFVRTYFLTEKASPDVVLVPLESDSDFEDDTNW